VHRGRENFRCSRRRRSAVDHDRLGDGSGEWSTYAGHDVGGELGGWDQWKFSAAARPLVCGGEVREREEVMGG
jgi:hypothetical protein